MGTKIITNYSNNHGFFFIKNSKISPIIHLKKNYVHFNYKRIAWICNKIKLTFEYSQLLLKYFNINFSSQVNLWLCYDFFLCRENWNYETYFKNKIIITEIWFNENNFLTEFWKKIQTIMKNTL